jgi:choline dehydrogenase-like flavoprotein
MLLSGLGPREQLATHQIPLVHDIPGVGEVIVVAASVDVLTA